MSLAGDLLRSQANQEITREQDRVRLIVGHRCGPECREDTDGPVLLGRRDEPRTEGRR